MAWYVVYEISTGALKGATANDAMIPVQEDLDARGFAVKSFANPPGDFVWNPATLEYDIPAPIRYRTIGTFEFFNRWTQAERTAMHTLAETDANVKDFIWRAGLTAEVRADWTALIQAMDYFVTQGVLTQARRDEIMGWDTE